MQITIDTNNLSELDINMLAFLAEQEPTAEEATTAEPVAETPKPAKAKTKAAAKPEPEAAEEEEEDLLGGDAPTIADAVAAATELVSSGGAPKVKAALDVVGVKRVTEMKEEDVPAFLAALAAAE